MFYSYFSVDQVGVDVIVASFAAVLCAHCGGRKTLIKSGGK